MISYQKAIEIITGLAKQRPLEIEKVPLFEAFGRISTQDILSNESVPAFQNSAMDGFALKSELTQQASSENPVHFNVAGMIAAGDIKAFQNSASLSSCDAVEIMTGAPMPQGQWNTVVRIEDVQVKRNSEGKVFQISIRRPYVRGENVRNPATDYKVGQCVVPRGVRFKHEHLMACASVGISRVDVFKKPRVAIISTGSELVEYDRESLETGFIRNSSAPYLASVLKNTLAADICYFGIIEDKPEVYRECLQKIMMENFDVVLSTGAVSMGYFDFVTEVLFELNAKVHFHKAAIRPGKPVLFAELQKQSGHSCLLFGMPGNPVSTAVALRFFVEPCLRAMTNAEDVVITRVRLMNETKKPEGLRCFYKGRLEVSPDGTLGVRALLGQASYMVHSLTEANCWISFDEAGSYLQTGSLVNVHSLHDSFQLLFSGGQI